MKNILLIVGMFSYVVGFGQLYTVNPSVPSASTALDKQSIEISNDLFNGKVNVSVPIYNYGFEGLNFPISIAYIGSNGIKPDELPSWVGSGWNLANGGGYIHRTVRGKPDEVKDYSYRIDNVYDYSTGFSRLLKRIKKTDLTTVNYSYFTNCIKLNTSNWYTQDFANTFKQTIDNIPYSYIAAPYPINNILYDCYSTVYNRYPDWDLVPDEFTFSFGTFSGKFYLNHLNKWVVRSNDGKKYSINVISGEQTVIDQNVQFTGGRLYYKCPSIIRCIIMTSQDGIRYTFGTQDSNIPFDKLIFDYSHASQVIEPNIGATYMQAPLSYIAGKDGPTYIDIVPHTWHLTKIENLKTNSVITFEYKQQGMEFYKTLQAWGEGGSGVTRHFIVYDNNSLKSYPDYENNPFSFYFLSAISKILSRRWTLTAINFPNGVKIQYYSSPSNQLSTDEKIMTSENSSFYNQEDIAYYTDNIWKQNNTLLELDSIIVSYNSSFSKGIIFDYILSGSRRLQLNKLKLKSTLGTIEKEYSFNYNKIALPAYGTGKVDHWGFYNGKDFFAAHSPYYSFTDLLNYTTSRDPAFDYSNAEILTSITYPTGGKAEFVYQPHSYSVTRQVSTVSDLKTNKESGGLRIEKVRYLSATSQLLSEINYSYNIPGSELSSGVLAQPIPIYLSGNDASYNFKARGFDPVYYEGGNVTYTNVTSTQTGNGRTEYCFTNYNNGYNDISPLSHNYGSNSIFPDENVNTDFTNNSFKRGLPISASEYNESGTLVKQTQFRYIHNQNEESQDEVRSLYHTQINRGIYYSAVSEKIYSDLLTNKEEINFSPAGFISTETNYTYDSFGNVKEIKRENSQGEIIIKSYKYNSEYATSANNAYDEISQGIKYLNQLGLMSEIIEEVDSKQVGTDIYITGGTLYTYDSQSAFLKKKYKLEITAPIPVNNFTKSSISSSGNFLKDPHYSLNPEAEITKYDSKGKILESTDKSGVISSFIWEDNQSLIVTKATGASINDIAVTSFEENIKGGWAFDLANIIGTYKSITGKKYYNVVGSGLLRNLDVSKTYVMSFWIKGGKPLIYKTLVNGTIQSIDAQFNYIKTLGEWSLLSGEIQNGSAIQIQKNGALTSYIDDLRIYPKGANITTYTYDPLVGMTSQSDENNRITYFEYDAANRLALILDQDKKIVKKYCYNYAGQMENCQTEICTNNTPNWLNITGSIRCQQSSTGQYTGSQEQQQKDINVCSSSYGQTRWIVAAYNIAVCPLPICNASTCSQNYQRCVYGNCETGIKVYTDTYFIKQNLYTCTFHYEWSDGTWSIDYTENSTYSCELI